MITFKQYLTEARMAPLYHGTHLEYLSDIMKYGLSNITNFHYNEVTLNGPIKIRTITYDTGETKKITNSTSENSKLYGVSLSRSLKFSTAFAKKNDSGIGYVVLELDQEKLSKKFRIIPVNYFSTHQVSARLTGDSIRNEFEEFVVTGKKKNIPFSFVNRVLVKPYLRDHPIIKELKEKYGREFIVLL